MLTQPAQPGCQFFVGRRDHSALARGQHFAGMKAEARHRRVRQPNAAASVFGADRACRVFNHPQAMLARDIQNSIEIRRMSIKMNRQNADRARRNRRLEKINIETVRFIYVDENGLRTEMNHWLDRRKCRV